MPIEYRHSFIINSMVLDKSIKFHCCSRKQNMQVLAHEIKILSNHLLASVHVLQVMESEKVNQILESFAVQCAALVRSRRETALSESTEPLPEQTLNISEGAALAFCSSQSSLFIEGSIFHM